MTSIRNPETSRNIPETLHDFADMFALDVERPSDPMSRPDLRFVQATGPADLRILPLKLVLACGICLKNLCCPFS